MLYSSPYICFLVLTHKIIFLSLGNGMLCWLFATRKKLRTQQNYFIVSLSFSDLLVGLTVLPCEYCAVLAHITKKENSMCIGFCGTLTSFNMIASTMNLILIAADRYLAIKRPFRYNEILTKRRIRLAILIGWIITFILVLLPFTWNNLATDIQIYFIGLVYTEINFTFIAVIGVGLGICYYTIVKLVKSKLADSGEKSSNPAGIKVCVLVAISFFVSWIPTCIVENLMYFQQNVPYEVMNASYFIMLMNPLLDPIMYAYYRRDFRGELSNYMNKRWSFLKSLLPRKENNNNNNNKRQNKFKLKEKSRLFNDDTTSLTSCAVNECLTKV